MTKTIDDVLGKLNPEELNAVLMNVFEVLRKDKFFANHPKLTPGGAYHLAIDALTVHKYTPDSAHFHRSVEQQLQNGLQPFHALVN